ncbi:MAG: FtsX-like permease family protein, partial [Terriglobia bacterium]
RVFLEKLLSGVQALPGVRSAGGTTVLPFYYGLSSPVKVTIEDRPHGFTTHSPSAPVVRVTPAYFSAMRTPLEAGRFFTAEDRPGTLPVAIVSREFARRFLAPGDRIGRHLRFAATRYTLEQKFTVVGVVGDVRYIGLDRDPAAVVYTPVAQFPTSALTLVLRSRVSPESLTNAIRAEVQKSNQEQPIYHVATMEQRLADSVGPQRFDAWLLELFASVAVSLAGIGIYGVMVYAVSERTHEIGIRVALGAQRKEVLKLMVGQALKLTLTGVGIGIIGALALTRFLTSLLYDVRPNDPLTFTAVSLILIAVALLASYTPARRATKVDPMVALRHE